MADCREGGHQDGGSCFSVAVGSGQLCWCYFPFLEGSIMTSHRWFSLRSCSFLLLASFPATMETQITCPDGRCTTQQREDDDSGLLQHKQFDRSLLNRRAWSKSNGSRSDKCEVNDFLNAMAPPKNAIRRR